MCSHVFQNCLTMVSIHKRASSSAMEVDSPAAGVPPEVYTPNIVRITMETLKKKADAADDLYEACVSCGRRCEDNRQAGKLGKCNTGK